MKMDNCRKLALFIVVIILFGNLLNNNLTQLPSKFKLSFSAERQINEAFYSHLAGNISSMATENQEFINHFCQYKLTKLIAEPRI